MSILLSALPLGLLTMGLASGALPVPTAMTGGCEDTWAIKINEFLANPDGSDPQVLEEWVELYNLTNREVDLSQWTLEFGTSSFSGSVTLSGTIAANGSYVIAEANAPVAGDLVLSPSEKLALGNASSSADAIRLMDCNGLIADTVVYGGSNTDLWTDDRGLVVGDDETAPKPGSGESIARLQDGGDSQIAAVDFCDDSSPSPAQANTCEDEGEGDDTGDSGLVEPEFLPCETDVRINEFLPNPDGDDSGAEWVELFNAGEASVDLSDWKLEWGTKSFSSSAVIGALSIEAGDHLVLGDEFVAEADFLVDLALGNASSSGDALRLVCPDGSVADTVVYGPNNEDAWIDDSGQASESLAAKPGNGVCIARIQDGFDTDLSAIDFHPLLSEDCTVGTENPFTLPAECVPLSAVTINEFLSDPDGTDDQHEWVELHSSETDTVRLDGWYLEIAKSSWSSVQFTFPSGSEIEGAGFLLLGGAEVPDSDFFTMDLDLGNAGSNGDGIRLVDCEGNVVDTVIYGENNDDGLVDDSGGIATSFSPNPDDDLSSGRYPDGADTNLSGEDFAICYTPTPGSPNGNCAEEGSGGTGGTGGGEGPGGCRCGDDGPSSEGDPNGDGCSQAGRAYGSMWAFLGVVIVLRRRREDERP